jgi:Uma2 family endonuclease
MAHARNLATYDDLLAIPEKVRAEILAGEIIVQPSPSFEHQTLFGGLYSELLGPFMRGRGGPGGWWIIPDVDVRFTRNDVVRPDLSGWRRVRLPSPGEKRPIDVVPDWICEVLSTNKHYDRTYKADLYATHGVGHYWLIDPIMRVLEAFALKSGRWERIGGYDEEAVAQIPPFEGYELTLHEPFGLLDLPPT